MSATELSKEGQLVAQIPGVVVVGEAPCYCKYAISKEYNPWAEPLEIIEQVNIVIAPQTPLSGNDLRFKYPHTLADDLSDLNTGLIDRFRGEVAGQLPGEVGAYLQNTSSIRSMFPYSTHLHHLGYALLRQVTGSVDDLDVRRYKGVAPQLLERAAEKSEAERLRSTKDVYRDIVLRAFPNERLARELLTDESIQLIKKYGFNEFGRIFFTTSTWDVEVSIPNLKELQRTTSY
jgi:hypothetical protein